MNQARERRVKRFIREGLSYCPPMTEQTVRDLADALGRSQGLSRERVSQLFDDEVGNQR